MKLIGLLTSAIVVYALVAACVLWPSNSQSGNEQARAQLPGTPGNFPGGIPNPRNKPAIAQRGHVSLDGLPYRSVTMQIQRPDWIEKYKQSLDEIVSVGADTVKFVVDARQENGRSARIYLDLRMTPSADQLSDLIKYAKSKGLRVILMPIVLLDNPIGDEWRGKISPLEDNGGWYEWWESYRAMLGYFAWIAQLNNVDVLVIGSELVSTQSNVEEWTKTINKVRETFKGRLTYSANWDNYWTVPFWDQLDMVGMNSYWKMSDNKGDKATLDDMKHEWKEIQGDLLPWLKKTGKPLLFLEIGWFSQTNAAVTPWDYTQLLEVEPLDMEIQKRLYEAFFQSWYGQPMLGGFSIWEWTPGDGGPKDSGYTPEGKPAEKVLREWLNKGPWQVKLGN
jgi:hypothetical protein